MINIYIAVKHILTYFDNIDFKAREKNEENRNLSFDINAM